MGADAPILPCIIMSLNFGLVASQNNIRSSFDVVWPYSTSGRQGGCFFAVFPLPGVSTRTRYIVVELTCEQLLPLKVLVLYHTNRL